MTSLTGFSTEQTVPTALVVWSTGNKASPLNEAITTLRKDKKQSLIVNEKLQVMRSTGDEGTERGARTIEGVYAMGDCAQIDGYGLPATAQVSLYSIHEV